VSYPPPGYQQPYGPPPPGYGPYPGYGHRQSNALAYVVAIAFVVLGGWTVVPAFIAADGSDVTPHLDASLIGVVFTEELTGNRDFAISASFTAGFTVLGFALVMFARLEFMRWILAVLGAIIGVYYIYAVIYLAAHDAGEFLVLPLVLMVVWIGATVVTLLPATRAAMRGRGPAPTAYPGPAGYPGWG
jgi:hypothetical protein